VVIVVVIVVVSARAEERVGLGIRRSP